MGNEKKKDGDEGLGQCVCEGGCECGDKDGDESVLQQRLKIEQRQRILRFWKGTWDGPWNWFDIILTEWSFRSFIWNNVDMFLSGLSTHPISPFDIGVSFVCKGVYKY